MPLRVVVTGSECTGKTTVAVALAARFGCPWSAEFARGHAESSGGPLGLQDVEPIARGQRDAEDAAVLLADRLVVHDTDLVSTVVYARHYYGACPGWIQEAARSRRADLYLLLHPDVDWSPDGVRDRPQHRKEIHALFADTLAALGATVVDVRGSWEERRLTAERAVAAALGVRGGER
jgi:NadR type nicotinamide-nucleotide adenylyltransferase